MVDLLNIQCTYILLSLGQQTGKVQLAIFLSKGNLEVEVISAKDICPPDIEEPGKIELNSSNTLRNLVNLRYNLFKIKASVKF